MRYLKYLTHSILALLLTANMLACGGGTESSEEKNNLSSMQSMETLDPHQMDDVPLAINLAEQREEASQTSEEPLDSVVTPAESEASPTNKSHVNLTGTVTYDRVNFQSRLFRGLDYDNIQVMPARGVTVWLVNAQGKTIDNTKTNERGEYSFTAPIETAVQVRVVAHIESEGNGVWSIQVKDNTNNSALYVMDGSLVSSGNNDTQTRNLHADSGWVNRGYNSSRTAAPFAIIDSLYDAVKAVFDAKPDAVLPPLNVFWSSENIAIGGSLSEGKIGTSFYTSAGPSIYLLGKANNDSDEYDRAVIQHEFGHFIEHQLSRTESLGGSHNVNSLLDMRVAFGEAWGNAFAGMVSNDPLYRDSLGDDQGLGFTINVQSRTFGLQGWFSEGSIQSVLFNLFDDEDSPSDEISLGFASVFRALTSQAYIDYDGFASIYPFVEVLKQQNPELTHKIDDLVSSYQIFGTGFYGEGETSDAGSDITLPVYNNLRLGETVEVCSDSAGQNHNGVDVYRMIKVDFDRRRTYNFNVNKTQSFVLDTNPQMRLYSKGERIASFTSSSGSSEAATITLDSGTYILEVYEQSNAVRNDNSGGLACFNVSVN